jgi:hypothetical protein
MKLHFKSVILLFFLIPTFLSLRAQTPNIVLGRPTDKSITINILFDANVIIYIEYGKTPGFYSDKTQETSIDANIPFVEVLTNLSSDTHYYYRINYRAASESKWKTSSEYSFQTWRPPGESFSFTIEADPHPYDKKCYYPLWDIALQNQLNDNADFMIDMGDTFGDDHNPFEITSAQSKQLHLNNREYFGSVCHSVPLFLCLGNHEGESGYYLLQTPPNNLAIYSTIWRKYYYNNPIPDGFYSGNSQIELNGIGLPENYYAWEWGDALFVVLDMYRYYTASAKPGKWDWTIGKKQYDWFKQTLESSEATYKFVFAHHVLGEARGGILLSKLYEWGGYDQKGNWAFDDNRPGWGIPLHQLMVDNHVTVFFQGHDHLFAKEEIDGLIYQTVPMPSDSSYSLGIIANGDAFSGTVMPGSGHIKVNVSPDSVVVDFVKAVLPQDERNDNKNGEVAFSYSFNGNLISSLLEKDMNFKNSTVKTWPNPFRDSVMIQFELIKSGKVEILIFDLAGIQIDRIDAGILQSGIHAVKWDGINRNGKVVRKGTYNCVIITPDGKISQKLILT